MKTTFETTNRSTAIGVPLKFGKARVVAAMLGVCPKTIHRLAARGKLRRYVLGSRTVVFSTDEAIKLVESHGC